MDSLLANYASSDDDDEQRNNQPQQHSDSAESLKPQKPPSSSSLFSSLPKPQSAASLFSSLPPPKSLPSSTQFTPKSTPSSTPASLNHGQTGGEEKGLDRDPNSGSNVSSGLFSSLPAPKSLPDSGPIPTSSQPSSVSKKRVVQFRPPVIQSSFKSDDKDDEGDEDDDEFLDKKKPQVINPNSSFKSFISSMPAPTNSATLGMSGTGGSGRRAIIETSVSSLSSDAYNPEKEVETVSIASSVQYSLYNGSISGSLGAVEGQLGAGPDVQNWGQPGEGYVGYEGYESYANYEGYASYGNDGHYDQNNWANAPSTWVAPEASVPGLVESVVRGSGKRRRDQIPIEIVEVNQDELMKNRPRQDQSKLTGIAFGPAYQPAPSGGGSGKPTKLHKRKHQIGSLYFDMKQKEMELSERRAKGMLTKAETQAKYGW